MTVALDFPYQSCEVCGWHGTCPQCDKIRNALALRDLVEKARAIWPGGSFVAISTDPVAGVDVVTVTLRDKNGAYPLRSGVGNSVADAVAAADAWESPFDRRAASEATKELES